MKVTKKTSLTDGIMNYLIFTNLQITKISLLLPRKGSSLVAFYDLKLYEQLLRFDLIFKPNGLYKSKGHKLYDLVLEDRILHHGNIYRAKGIFFVIGW